MSNTIGFIGTGLIGGGVAKLAVKAGYKVVVSNSRGPETLTDVVKELGANAKADTSKNIASNDDIKVIILSIPLKAVPGLLKDLNLKNKIILDTSNYYPQRDGQIEVLDSRELTTSEYVVKHLDPSNKLVKVFHNIDSVHLQIASTNDVSKQTTLPISTDDDEAKKVATEFINKIGFQVIDAGSLKDNWRIEPGTEIYGKPYIPNAPEGQEWEATRKFFLETPATPLTKEKAQELIDNAQKREKVGGFFSDLPPVWGRLLLELYKESGKA